jgi:hypothetical protein
MFVGIEGLKFAKKAKEKKETLFALIMLGPTTTKVN